MTITPADVRAALILPQMNVQARRLPKDLLVQHGAANTGDRKLIEEAIERLDWWATLSPTTIGIAAGTDEERPVPAIQLLALTARAEPTQRLLTMIHRAIPVPIILATGLPGGGGTCVSLASLRRAERAAGQMVVERLVIAPDLTKSDLQAGAFLASLALVSLPQTTLAAVYDALMERIESLAVARILQVPFQLPADAATAARRRDALARYVEAESEWIAARAAARREKRLAQQVLLGNQARELKDRLLAIGGELAAAPISRP
jgi:hypothetical protein